MNKKEIVAYFIVLTTLFALSALAGYQAAKNNPIEAEQFLHQFSSELGFIKFLPPIVIFLLIFLNNSVKALIAMILGIFFGLVPIFFVFINGYLVGLVLYTVGLKMGLRKVLMMILPHGVIEIPAIILACSYGLWLGRMFYRRITGDRISIKTCINAALNYYFRIVVPMLVIAAFVEAYITPHLA